MKISIKKIFICVLILISFCSLSSFCALAEVEKESKYYLGEAVNAGKDTGYSESNAIDNGDPNFGWTLGEFFVSGYSTVEKDTDDSPVFLKNVGDTVTLWFCLDQDINKLNGDEGLVICEDKDGFDEYFGVEKTNFGKGTLIVRHKDSENHWAEPAIYTNYLEAVASQGAYTQVQLFEEGDYEVALNYEVKKTNLNIFGWDPVPSYTNYRIFFRFSVRNGNCMVYPFDVTTKVELTNLACTENGFYLDLANSKYLDVSIKKEVLNQSAEGLVEDVRFNRPAKEGEKYTEEGIYTITVKNEYTEQETIKKIYVGKNNVMKAHVATGFSIEEINHQLELGSTIAEDGTLISPVVSEETDSEIQDEQDFMFWIIIGGVVLLLFIIGIIIVIRCKNRKTQLEVEEGDKE